MAKGENYDSDFCGSLPLNHINVIQDYGFLIVLEKQSFNIIQFSENVPELLDKSAEDIISTPLHKYTDQAVIKKLQQRSGENLKEKIPFKMVLADKQMLGIAHFKDDYLVLELEKSDLLAERSFSEVFEEIKYAMAAIEQPDTIVAVSQQAIHELRKLTGFDGIMMYRFDEDWNGTVIAEEKVPELETYIGHTFPASDIPKQARQLYLQNPYRLIPNREYKPLRLYPVINPASKTFTDLSGCNVRGVAAVHLEYLKNMNVKASMSIRVIHHGKLWGLIACHHITPRYLSLELCAVCELLSSVISNKISAIIYKENFDKEAELQKVQTAIVAQVYANNDLLTGILTPDQPNLAQLFNATGAVAIIDGQITTLGKVPGMDVIENMIFWLQSKGIEKLFVTDQLPEVYEEAVPYADIASGALVIPVNKDKGNYIICFRPEVIQTIKWGGDPNNTITFEPDGKNYHPRNSFKLWQQIVRQTAINWDEQEQEVAENMRSFIYEYTTRQND